MRKKELKTSPEHSDRCSEKRVRRNRELPIGTICRNCGSQLYSRYCHNCGQDLFAGRVRKLRSIIYNTFDTIFAIDNKILETLKYLLFYPGRLTNEYLSGHIVRYVLPAKLFWFISIIFFFFFSLQIDTSKLESAADDGNAVAKDSIPAVQVSQERSLNITEEDGIMQSNEGILNDVDIKEFVEALMKYLPYAMLLATPLFAFLLYITFRKRLRYYADNMIFALHFHSFVFILFGVLMVIGMIVHYEWIPWVWLYMFIPLLYLIAASRNVYKLKFRILIRKALFIAASYFFVLIFILILLASVVIRILYGVNIFTA